MSEALEPRLTTLDQRVLSAAPASRGARLEGVAARVHRGLLDRLHSPWKVQRAQALRQLREVHGVLRGLEHLGLVSGRGGWWRKTPAGYERAVRDG